MQFFLYCLCGGCGVTTDYALYFIALKLGIGYQVANALGYVSGTLVSFFLNRKFTFGIHDKVAQRLALFMGMAGIGFAVSAFMLWLMVGIGHFDPRISKLFTLPVVVLLQFTLNRLITFRKKRA